MRNNDGAADWRSTSGARGNETEVAVFDEAGTPVRNKHGVAGWRSRYNARGDETERAYLDEASEPVRDKEDGHAGCRKISDPQGAPMKLAT